MTNLETKFQNWVKSINCYSYKPTDFKSLMFLVSNFPNIMNKIPQVPCDKVVVYKGKSFFFELKYVVGKSMNFSTIKDHQIGALLNHQVAGGGLSYVVFGFKYKGKLLVYAVNIVDVVEFIRKHVRSSFDTAFCSTVGVSIAGTKDLQNLLEMPFQGIVSTI